jgi:ABC-type phosphate transport system permease subunit
MMGLAIVIAFVLAQVAAIYLWTNYANRKYGKRTTTPPTR